jgi:hypothetical protein
MRPAAAISSASSTLKGSCVDAQMIATFAPDTRFAKRLRSPVKGA